MDLSLKKIFINLMSGYMQDLDFTLILVYRMKFLILLNVILFSGTGVSMSSHPIANISNDIKNKYLMTQNLIVKPIVYFLANG